MKMDEPPKIKPDANGLLNRLAGQSKLQKTLQDLPVETEERYARWWEMRLLGTTIPEIIKFEKKNGYQYTERQVKHGLDLYASICLDETGRVRRMSQHRAFVDKLRQIAMSQVQSLRKEFMDSNGKGLKIESEETNYDADGNPVSSKKRITYERIDKSMVAWLKFAVDLDKYGATIDGLLGELDQSQDIDFIDVNIEGFIGFDDEDEKEEKDE